MDLVDNAVAVATNTSDTMEQPSPRQPTTTESSLLLNPAQMQLSSRIVLPLGPNGSDVLFDLADLPRQNPEEPSLFDPTLLPSLPRVDNQYNQDYVDHSHARNHGHFYAAQPDEEWTRRSYSTARYWFYRAWFHDQTIRWDHDDAAYFKTTHGFFLDQHPYSTGSDYHYRVWRTRGWQLVLGATPSLPIWPACNSWEQALFEEEQRLETQGSPPEAHPRGRKCQAVDNLEYTRVDNMLEHMLQQFSQLDVSTSSGVRHLTPVQQNTMLDGLVHTLTIYQEELQII